MADESTFYLVEDGELVPGEVPVPGGKAIKSSDGVVKAKDDATVEFLTYLSNTVGHPLTEQSPKMKKGGD